MTLAPELGGFCIVNEPFKNIYIPSRGMNAMDAEVYPYTEDYNVCLITQLIT